MNRYILSEPLKDKDYIQYKASTQTFVGVECTKPCENEIEQIIDHVLTGFTQTTNNYIVNLCCNQVNQDVLNIPRDTLKPSGSLQVPQVQRYLINNLKPPQVMCGLLTGSTAPRITNTQPLRIGDKRDDYTQNFTYQFIDCGCDNRPRDERGNLIPIIQKKSRILSSTVQTTNTLSKDKCVASIQKLIQAYKEDPSIMTRDQYNLILYKSGVVYDEKLFMYR